MDLAALAPHTRRLAVVLYASDPRSGLTCREQALIRLKLDQPTWSPAPEESPVPLHKVQAWYDGLKGEVGAWVQVELTKEEARHGHDVPA